MKYSTALSNDPEIHDDFRPTSKLETSGVSTKEVVEQDVKENPVMIYIKRIPDFPQCGFSSLAVRVLKQYRALVPWPPDRLLLDNLQVIHMQLAPFSNSSQMRSLYVVLGEEHGGGPSDAKEEILCIGIRELVFLVLKTSEEVNSRMGSGGGIVMLKSGLISRSVCTKVLWSLELKHKAR
ncbi:hypothetical protein Ancab_036375 [Ancistrocladus abbreviatus]